MGLRERGVLRPGRRFELGMDRISLEDPPSALHEIDLGFSFSASQPSVSGSAVEVARSLLDLGHLGVPGAGVAGVPVSCAPVDVVSAVSLSPARLGPSAGSSFAGL